MKSTSTKSTTFSSLFLGLLLAALFLVPAKAEAVKLEPNDFELFTINLPVNLDEDYDSDSGTMSLITRDEKFGFVFTPFEVSNDFDFDEAMMEILDETGVDYEDAEFFEVNAGGKPFYGTSITDDEDGAIIGYIVDYENEFAVFIVMSSHPADFGTLLEIASSIRVAGK